MESRYPENWKERSLDCRTLANWTCQHCGKLCRRPREALDAFIARTGYKRALVEQHPRKWTAQAAHLNHDPENPEAELVALCLPCHRRYDNPQMARIKHLERERQGQITLDQQDAISLEGFQLPLKQLAEPYGLLNGKSLKTVTPGTLIIWLEDRLRLIDSSAERLTFLRQFLPESNPDYWVELSKLRESLPYECSSEDLLAACAQVFSNLNSPVQAERRQQRRYRRKGHASGYIESREGNKARRSPSISYYYKWDSPEGRVSEYIPAGKVILVDRLIKKSSPALHILRTICQSKKAISPLSAKLLSPFPAQGCLI
jgi:hypothetical protein